MYKDFTAADVKASPSSLSQLIDIIQEDVSGSLTRRKYQVFVTGGIGPGITSSLFQTVYDQDFTLQTANPVMDLSVGLFKDGNTVTTAPGYNADTPSGKILFASNSVMMREKIDVYKQYASFLLGNANEAFFLGASTFPRNNGVTTTATDRIDEAMFINVKRLFARDRIRKETFAMRFYTSASISGGDDNVEPGTAEGGESNYATTAASYAALLTNRTGSNVNIVSEEGVQIFADIGANSDSRTEAGGSVARLKMASNTAVDVGLLFYDYGIAVFDLKKASWANQHMSGTIDGMNANNFRQGTDAVPGETISKGNVFIGHTGTHSTHLKGGYPNVGSLPLARADGNYKAKFIPDFLVSASIDNIIDHLAGTRFSSGTLTSMAFQNQTNIQSSIYFCRAAPGEFNYSTNPTFTNDAGDLMVIEDASDPTERSFSFITTVGLYNANNELMAVGKLSRPIEKNDEKDLTVRVRLDF